MYGICQQSRPCDSQVTMIILEGGNKCKKVTFLCYVACLSVKTKAELSSGLFFFLTILTTHCFLPILLSYMHDLSSSQNFKPKPHKFKMDCVQAFGDGD